MLVVDFMHEVELGVWKALFAHLIRILYTVDSSGSLVAELDLRFDTNFLRIDIELKYIRYRQVSPFSQTIHRFSNNISEMKKLAARDHENLLQVRTFLVKSLKVLTASHSVVFQHSKVSLMNLTTHA